MLFKHLSCMYYILVNLDVPEQVQVTNCAWKCQVASDTHEPMKSEDSDGDAQDQT